MKTKSIIAMSLMAALAVGCSSDDIVDDGTKNPGTAEGQAYIGVSISLPVSRPGMRGIRGTRSTNDDYEAGAANEYKVNTLTIRYLDNDGTEKQSFEYDAADLNWEPSSATGITTTAVLPVEKVGFTGTAYALVEINSPWEASIAGNAVVENITASHLTGAKKDDFFMTNTVWKDGHYLVPVTTSDTKDKAQSLAATHTIYVERAAAKVQLNVVEGDGWNTSIYTIPDGQTNAGAAINIQNWVLDVTNKSMFPIRKFGGTNSYPSESYARLYSVNNADFRTYWAEDPNYSAYVNNGFNVITEYPAKPNNLDGVEYCAENTFDVKNQCQNQTTRALIKAEYTPAGMQAGASWFTIGNSSTALNATTLAERIKKAAGAANDAVVELIDDAFTAGQEEFNNTMFTIGGETPNPETLNKVKNALGKVTTYKNGVCYYVVRIKHFGDEICPWGEAYGYEEYKKGGDGMSEKYLGRYGVVRNNWYKVTINSVSQPGDPTIPELTDKQDDEHNNYLQSTVKILDWAVRNQGVDL